MRFEFFKIGDTELKSVLSVVISKAPRNRKEYTNLNGDLMIDQMAIKSTVDVEIVIVSDAVMAIIENAVAAGFVDISYYEGGTLRTISATVSSSERPRPFYMNGKRENGVYYNAVRLTFKEK